MLDIALKEWACVCDLLVEGKVCLLLRKGGVHEDGGPARFRLEHDRFALFPAWEHENLAWIKPELRPARGPIDVEPPEITFRGYAEVVGLWEVPSRTAFDRLDDLHPWRPPQVDMRFDYKPERPLYAVLVLAYRFDQPHVIPNCPSFAGCRSWVPLDAEDRPHASGEPAMSDAAVAAAAERIAQALG
ncbi:MAG: DUF1802 family protein [Planctomycetota bacterium]